MSYTMLRGSFVVRCSDQPRQGPEPDGDHPGDPAEPDGTAVVVDEALTDRSADGQLLTAGHPTRVAGRRVR